MNYALPEDLAQDFAREIFAKDATALQELSVRLRTHDPLSLHASLIEGLEISMQGDLPRSIRFIEDLEQKSIEQGVRDPFILGWISSTLGHVYWASGLYDQAQMTIGTSIKHFESVSYKPGLANSYANASAVYAALGLFENSIVETKRAIALYEEIGESVGLAGMLINLAGVYVEIDDKVQALELLERSYDLFLEIGSVRGTTNVKGNIGNVYMEMGEFESALPYLEESVDLALEHGLSRESGFFLTSLALIYFRLGRLEDAEGLLDRHEAVIAQNPIPVTAALAVRGLIVSSRGDHASGVAIIQEAIRRSEETNDRQDLLALKNNLREIAKNGGDFELYVKTNEEFIVLEQELKGAAASRRISAREREDAVAVERRAREKERTILYSTLPRHVADRLVKGEEVTDHFDMASVLFVDIVGFTKLSDSIPAGHVVHLLKAIFKVCDDACSASGVTKIKTIGDSYLAVAGIPEPLSNHAHRAALAALQLIKGLDELELTMDPKLGDTGWTKDIGDIQVRIGIHCGPLVAGIVGDERLQYDVWGDTVNVASRMESSGEAGKVHVSEAFAVSLASADNVAGENILPGKMVKRGEIEIKGKGPMTTYWLEGA